MMWRFVRLQSIWDQSKHYLSKMGFEVMEIHFISFFFKKKMLKMNLFECATVTHFIKPHVSTKM